MAWAYYPNQRAIPMVGWNTKHLTRDEQAQNSLMKKLEEKVKNLEKENQKLQTHCQTLETRVEKLEKQTNQECQKKIQAGDGPLSSPSSNMNSAFRKNMITIICELKKEIEHLQLAHKRQERLIELQLNDFRASSREDQRATGSAEHQEDRKSTTSCPFKRGSEPAKIGITNVDPIHLILPDIRDYSKVEKISTKNNSTKNEIKKTDVVKTSTSNNAGQSNMPKQRNSHHVYKQSQGQVKSQTYTHTSKTRRSYNQLNSKDMNALRQKYNSVQVQTTDRKQPAKNDSTSLKKTVEKSSSKVASSSGAGTECEEQTDFSNLDYEDDNGNTSNSSESESDDTSEYASDEPEEVVEKCDKFDLAAGQYPTKKEALRLGIDLQKPFPMTYLLVGKNEFKGVVKVLNCLSELYEYEKIYKNFSINMAEAIEEKFAQASA